MTDLRPAQVGGHARADRVGLGLEPGSLRRPPVAGTRWVDCCQTWVSSWARSATPSSSSA
ncbi:MAG: hypothetical protein U1F43_09255 [Myxococcota bacterium]